MSVSTGLRGTAALTVRDEDTATAMGSGDVSVLATPRIIGLSEAATVDALAGHLDPGTTSVGMRIRVDHLQPTAVGEDVTAEAVLEQIDGRRLTFTVSVSDRGGLVAAGKITRTLVNRDKFLTKCCSSSSATN